MGCSFLVTLSMAAPALASPMPLACPSASAFTFSAKQKVTGEIHVKPLARLSLHEAEASLFQAAKRLLASPRLFLISIYVNGLLRQYPSPDDSADISAEYESPCDKLFFLALEGSMDGKTETASLGKAAFAYTGTSNSCGGAAPLFSPPPPRAVLVPQSEHPPVLGWTVDVPRLRKIVTKHHSLFGRGVERLVITTVAHLLSSFEGTRVGPRNDAMLQKLVCGVIAASRFPIVARRQC